MIFLISSVKSEALLLFCREIIISYKDQDNLFDIDKEKEKKIFKVVDDFLEQINKVIPPRTYFLENNNRAKVKIMLKFFSYLEKKLSKYLKKNEVFNPFMLVISLLSFWFVELEKEGQNKKFLYFILYPYFELFDLLFLNSDDLAFKEINIKMVDIAEKLANDLDKYKI